MDERTMWSKETVQVASQTGDGDQCEQTRELATIRKRMRQMKPVEGPRDGALRAMAAMEGEDPTQLRDSVNRFLMLARYNRDVMLEGGSLFCALLGWSALRPHPPMLAQAKEAITSQYGHRAFWLPRWFCPEGIALFSGGARTNLGHCDDLMVDVALVTQEIVTLMQWTGHRKSLAALRLIGLDLVISEKLYHALTCQADVIDTAGGDVSGIDAFIDAAHVRDFDHG